LRARNQLKANAIELQSTTTNPAFDAPISIGMPRWPA
jgi:hypothetical protein